MEILKGLKDCIRKTRIFFKKKNFFESLQSMLALRISVFNSVSNDILPNSRVCVKKELLDYNILQSVLFKVLRRVCL